MPARNDQVQTMDRAALEKRQQTLAAFVALVNLVPDAPEGDVTDLLGPILAAQSWEDLAKDTTLPSSKTLTDIPIRLESIAKRVSDKESITGYYLICDGFNMDTGESLRFTAGGGEAVAKMAQLHVLHELPAKIKFVPVQLPDGNIAINCKVLDVFRTTIDA